MSTGDRHMRCPTCGLPYYYIPSDVGDYASQNICQCNRSYYVNINVGWSCPKCGNVYSPDTKECLQCNNKRFTVTTTDWETNT